MAQLTDADYLPPLPDPDHIPTNQEMVDSLNARGIGAYIDPRTHDVALRTSADALKVLRLSEALLRPYHNARYLTVELWHPTLRIAQLDVVLTKEAAWDWMKDRAKGSWYVEGGHFVLDQGPVIDGDEHGERLRSKYTVESGHVISQGWEKDTTDGD